MVQPKNANSTKETSESTEIGRPKTRNNKP